ncbi:ArnT family glycosyltransferase [Thalassotalea litorea]|uniref:ArnT family glycosyltransferase n=1 Tax=Thalassotalea litorea TaxID=2020715 RepID=UPI003734EE78
MGERMLATPGLLKQFVVLTFALLSLVLIVALYLPGLDTIWLYHEETRRALVAREMMENTTWFTPTINQQAYWAKPPLFNWSIILASVFTDGQINELSARLPSLLSTLVLIVFLLLFTRRYFSYRLQIWLLFMVLFTPELTRKATSAELDTVFMVLVNLSWFSWFYFWQKHQSKRAWFISMTFVGLAYLCKREAALLCYFLSVIGFLIYSRSWHSINKRDFFTALLIPIFCAAIWWVPMLVQFGLDASIELNQAEVTARQNRGSNIEYLTGVIGYPFKIIVALLPASLLLPLLFNQHCRLNLKSTYGHFYHFCLITVIGNLLPLMLIGDSNVRYYLPMFIPALLLSTMILNGGFTAADNTSTSKTLWPTYYRTWLTKPIPLLFSGVLLIACTLLIITAPVSLPSSLGLVGVISLTVLFMVHMLRKTAYTKTAPQATSFMLFSIILVLLIRLVDISYSLPYRYQSLAKYRNIEAMLTQIKHIRNDLEQHNLAQGNVRKINVYGDHKLSHGIYFYDKTHLITSVNCQSFENNRNALWVFIKKQDEPIDVATGDTLMAQFPYTKKYRLFVIATTSPSQYCQAN